LGFRYRKSIKKHYFSAWNHIRSSINNKQYEFYPRKKLRVGDKCTFRSGCNGGRELHKKIGIIISHFYMFFYLLVMDVDCAVPGMAAADAVEAAALALARETARRDLNVAPDVLLQQNQLSQQPTNQQVTFTPGNVFLQCSAAKVAGMKADIFTSNAGSGSGFSCQPIQIPRIGKMYREGEDEMSKTFHGARIMRGGILVNECISASFDPETLNCITCKVPHSIVNNGSPVAICFSDQNFTPYITGTDNSTCVSVVRLEDGKLGDLALLALEILENTALFPGSVLMFGSASHLFTEGVSHYAQSWISLLNRIGSKLKNINICPLFPILRDDCPGPLARDLELLAMWLSRVYSGSIRGLSEAWDMASSLIKSSSTGNFQLESGEIIKLPLPKDLSSPAMATTFYRYTSSCPATLNKVDCKAASELVRGLANVLHRDFSITVRPEAILPRATMTTEAGKDIRHLICIGASIMTQCLPFLHALGYTITDLTRPGWLATDTNIASLIKEMSAVQLDTNIKFMIVLDLFSNCSHRFVQFDGTQALAFKDTCKYHMAGAVTTCTDEVFKKIIRSLSPVLLSAQEVQKLVLPPLPRYLFSPCCPNSSHCTNLSEDNYAEKSLSGLAKLRGILKKECKAIGMKNYWILDGVGSVAGSPPGKSAGSASDVLSDLKPALANDGVHLTTIGNRNLAGNINSTIAELKSGTLRGDSVLTQNSVTGKPVVKRKPEFFWRGFVSSTGDLPGRAVRERVRDHPRRGRHPGHAHVHAHPYHRRGR
jgi:hypothetical protein